jgi:hypothetical protein
MSTCDRLDLQTQGSPPISMPKNLPDHWSASTERTVRIGNVEHRTPSSIGIDSILYMSGVMVIVAVNRRRWVWP